MTKTTSGEVVPALNGFVGSDTVQLPYKSVFVITFRKNVPKTKNGLERCVLRFSEICAKNQVLKLNIDKVTIISVHSNPPSWLPSPVQSTWVRLGRLVTTVRHRLLPMSSNFGQHPPFFSKMRTFFKNRPPWYGFYKNSATYNGGRFLSCIFKKKFFFLLGSSVRSVGAGKLFVLDFPMHPVYMQPPYKLAIFKCP
jgi:hypothetical protein